MAVKSGYTVGRPIQDVRLRNWPAGKVAQLKRAVEQLESQLNETMAAQVGQGTKAVVSPRVPKVTGVVIHAGFKNFQVIFNDAKGIADLLFYEIQQDTTPTFSDPTIFRIPQTTLTLPTTEEHQQIYIRVRCQNSKFEVGPWSATVHATGSSNFRISINRAIASGLRGTVEVSFAESDTWIDVTGVSYTPSAAATCLQIHAGMYTHNTDPRSLVNALNYTSIVSNRMIFRILRNGVELTNAGTMELKGTATYNVQPAGADTDFFGRRQENTEVGTMITPFETFIGNEATVTYLLQAMLIGADSPRTSTIGTAVANESVTIIVDAFDVLEIIQSL